MVNVGGWVVVPGSTSNQQGNKTGPTLSIYLSIFIRERERERECVCVCVYQSIILELDEPHLGISGPTYFYPGWTFFQELLTIMTYIFI